MVSVRPRHRDAALLVLALGLLAAPLWITPLGLAEPTYHYDRAEVTVDDGEIRFVDSDVTPQARPLSEHVACTGTNYRTCAFETFLADGGTVPGSAYVSSPTVDHPGSGLEYYHEYAFIDGDDGVYEPTYEVNETPVTVDGDTMYELTMTVESVAPADALSSIAIPADQVAPAVRDAAASGAVASASGVDPPKTPVQTADGSFYRVYRSGTDVPPAIERSLEDALTVGAPLAGVGLVLLVSRRFDISYNGEQP